MIVSRTHKTVGVGLRVQVYGASCTFQDVKWTYVKGLEWITRSICDCFQWPIELPQRPPLPNIIFFGFQKIWPWKMAGIQKAQTSEGFQTLLREYSSTMVGLTSSVYSRSSCIECNKIQFKTVDSRRVMLASSTSFRLTFSWCFYNSAIRVDSSKKIISTEAAWYILMDSCSKLAIKA